jgi:signal transduction histidine kinase
MTAMPAPVDILLVDDEARNLDALESILVDPGFRLLRAQDADKALRLLLEHDVAAIVLDIKMPGVSGVELARIIKNTKRFRETPIVFLTAHMLDDADVIAGYGAGGVDYLTKPVNPQILRHKLAVFADLFRKTRELAEVNQQLAALNETLEERVKERTAELEKSEAALRTAAAQKDEFLAVLAHELRNPLAPLRTGLDLLLQMQPSAPSPIMSRTMSAMNRQLDHMVRLIDDLLDISRISRGLLELKRDRVDLAAIVRAAVDGARPWFERRKQTLALEIAGELHAHADPTRIAQIVTNLLHNATKFTPEGGAVRIEARTHAERVAVRVIDSGVGIGNEQLARVFDMFVRLPQHGGAGTATEPGLGIGLALARRLALMHEGELHAASEGAGRGTTFTLEIPAAAQARASAAAGAQPAAISSDAGQLEIVVVEDNDDAADTLVYWLEQLGHKVAIARTGSSGLALIRDSRPDLVLCDIGLPELDGLDVCRQVRALQGDKRPVMVALTGWGREDDLRRTREAGFDQHLVKPVAADKLRAIIQGVHEARAAS